MKIYQYLEGLINRLILNTRANGTFSNLLMSPSRLFLTLVSLPYFVVFCFSLFLMLFCILPVRAQINESDTLGFHFISSVNGRYQTGNVEFLMIRGSVDVFIGNHNKWAFKTENNQLLQRFGDITVDNDLNSRNFIYYKPTNRVYPFALVFGQTNLRRKIDNRFFGGLGVTYQLLSKKGHNVKISTTLTAERTLFNTAQYNITTFDGSKTLSLWRGVVYLHGFHKFEHRNIHLFYSIYAMPAFEQNLDRFYAQAGIDLKIWKGLSLRLGHLFQYEELVPIGVKQTDNLSTVGISFRFKK